MKIECASTGTGTTTTQTMERTPGKMVRVTGNLIVGMKSMILSSHLGILVLKKVVTRPIRCSTIHATNGTNLCAKFNMKGQTILKIASMSLKILSDTIPSEEDLKTQPSKQVPNSFPTIGLTSTISIVSLLP